MRCERVYSRRCWTTMHNVHVVPKWSPELFTFPSDHLPATASPTRRSSTVAFALTWTSSSNNASCRVSFPIWGQIAFSLSGNWKIVKCLCCSEDLRTYIELCPSTASFYSHSLNELKRKKKNIQLRYWLLCLCVTQLKLVRVGTHCVKKIFPHVKTHLANLRYSPPFFLRLHHCLPVLEKHFSSCGWESGKHRWPATPVVISSALNDLNPCSCFLRKCDLAKLARSCVLTCQARHWVTSLSNCFLIACEISSRPLLFILLPHVIHLMYQLQLLREAQHFIFFMFHIYIMTMKC